MENNNSKYAANLTGNNRFHGYCIDLLTKLSDVIKDFDYEIHLEPNADFGSPQKNGSWTGMIGELTSGVRLFTYISALDFKMGVNFTER